MITESDLGTNQDPVLEVYFFRHAESEMNTTPHLVGGRSNEVHLTPKGIDQAKKLGRYLSSKQITPIKVYVSPAIRTLETAEYALTEMGLDVEPLVAEAIQELAQGIHEGEPRDEVYTPEVLADIRSQGKNFKLEGGESMNDVGQRMHGWLTETFDQDPTLTETQRYFVFSHGGAIKYLASHLHGWEHQQTFETPVDNASINLFTFHDDQWRLEYLNNNPDEA